jgi:hypothetical protein
MRCRNCHRDNPAGKKFYSERGEGSSGGCPRCIAATAKFRGECGASLSAPARVRTLERCCRGSRTSS